MLSAHSVTNFMLLKLTTDYEIYNYLSFVRLLILYVIINKVYTQSLSVQLRVGMIKSLVASNCSTLSIGFINSVVILQRLLKYQCSKVVSVGMFTCSIVCVKYSQKLLCFLNVCINSAFLGHMTPYRSSWLFRFIALLASYKCTHVNSTFLSKQIPAMSLNYVCNICT